MATRSCTPPRESASPESNSFVCYHCLSDYTPERSRTPATPRQRETSAPDALLVTPTARRVSLSVGPMLCTPQTSREELQWRANLDAELSARRPAFAPAPPVTPLVDGLYIGGVPDEEALPVLRREGIRTIVNCCAAEYDAGEAARREFTVHTIPAEDKSDFLILFHCYDQFAEIVNEARRRGQRVYVHCIAGINRSVTLCMAYLMQYYNMDPVSCVRFFRSRGRLDIMRNVAFRHQLVDYYINTLRA